MEFDYGENRIEVWIRARKIKKADLSRKLGVTRFTLRNAIVGRNSPSLRTVLNLMYYLDVKFEDLYPTILRTASLGYNVGFGEDAEDQGDE